MQSRVVVIGGGISGLSAAWSVVKTAEQLGGPVPEVLLLEAGAEVGGKTQTLQRGPWRLEAGPTGFLDNEPALDELVGYAGLEKLPADPAAARRYLVNGGKLREIQTNPLKFPLSRILSPLGLLRIAREPWIAKRVSEVEESIWDFAERRLGEQAAERLISPMVLGVFAGDARALSLPAAFPRMAQLEAEYTSLFRAMAKLAQAKKLAGGPGGPSGALTSFAGGLQDLPRALASRAPFEVRTGARVCALHNSGGSAWHVDVEGQHEPIACDSVILATEAWNVASLLAGHAEVASAELQALSTPGVAVVGLGYGPQELARAPRGFGALIARPEGFRILGVLWDTFLFPQRSPDGHLLVRCMLGGATDTEAVGLSDEELVRTAHADLGRLMGFENEPVFSEVVKWPHAIPQYEVGHLARVKRIDADMQALSDTHPGLHLAGNFRVGIAFGKAAAQGRDAGMAAAEGLAARAVLGLTPS